MRVPNRTRPSLPSTSVAFFVLLAACVFAAVPAAAQIHSYTITGTVDGANLDTGSYLPPAVPPFAGGGTFTLTFDLDDSTPLTFGGATFADYSGAITNLDFTASTGEFIDSPMTGVFETTGGGGDAWFTTSGDIFQPGFATNIPDLMLDDGSGSFDTFFFEIGGLDLLMSDSLGMLYLLSPPELIAPDATTTDLQVLEINWGSFFEDTATLPLTIQTISVPEPSGGTLFAVGCLALVSAASRRR